MRELRSFLRRNPCFGLLAALLPGLLLVEAGAAGTAFALELLLALVLVAAGARGHALALAVLAGVLLPRVGAARHARLAELADWRAERSGTLILVGRAEARGEPHGGHVTYLFRVKARAARPGATALPRTGWIRIDWGAPGADTPPGPVRPAADRAGRGRSQRSAATIDGGGAGGGRPAAAPSADAPPVGRDIEVSGTFRPERPAQNPGSLDWGALAGGPRVRGSLGVAAWRPVGGASPLLQGARERLSARIEALFPPLSGGFMQAALFGDRERLDPRLRQVFSRTGTGHIVAISGMNVVILAAIGWAALTPFVHSLRRRRRVLAAALLLYVPLAGSSPSVARAALMAVAVLWAQGANRRVLLLNAMGAAGLALLLAQPEALLDPSFQLSFVAVLGLAALPELPGRRLVGARCDGAGPTGRVSRVARAAGLTLLGGALDLAVVTLASLAATLPLTLGYFRRLPLLALPANLVVVPALGALTAGGFAALLSSAVCPPLGRVYARACDVLLALVFRALEVFAAPPWASLVLPGPRSALAAAGAAVTALALVAVTRRRARLAAVAALLVGPVLAGPWLGPRPGRRLEAAVLSVGQGDAIAVLLPSGKALLVDGGPAEAGETVTAFLRERGVRRLARVFATHPDADHTGGLSRVLAELPTDSVHDPAQWGPGSPYRKFLEASWKAGAGYRPLAAGDRLRYGAVTIDVLWPPPGLAGRDPYWEGLPTNDASLVLLIGYGRFRMLLTGDIGGEVEARLAGRYADSLASGFLKVAHHGSRFSSAGVFLERVGARVALVSVGRDNRYGHPSPEALARLARGATVWRTDRDGALLLETDGEAWELAGFGSGRSARGRLDGDSPGRGSPGAPENLSAAGGGSPADSWRAGPRAPRRARATRLRRLPPAAARSDRRPAPRSGRPARRSPRPARGPRRSARARSPPRAAGAGPPASPGRRRAGSSARSRVARPGPRAACRRVPRARRERGSGRRPGDR
jgi:competence protein ComEC